MSSRDAAIEALTGGDAGWVLSCEIIAIRVPTPFHKVEGNTTGSASASIRRTLRSPADLPPCRRQKFVIQEPDVMWVASRSSA